MSDRNETEDVIADRFEARGESDVEETAGGADDTPDSSRGLSRRVENFKDEWTGITVFVDDELQNELDSLWKEVAYELDGEFEDDPIVEDLRKLRHCYPLVIKHGIAAVSEMETDELVEEVREIEPNEK